MSLMFGTLINISSINDGYSYELSDSLDGKNSTESETSSEFENEISDLYYGSFSFQFRTLQSLNYYLKWQSISNLFLEIHLPPPRV